jgi:sulfate permease, SulP family
MSGEAIAGRQRPIKSGGLPAGTRLDHRELAGAVADLGVLLPIGVALVVANGLSATAVLLPAGLLYVTAALAYRLPVPVQPLKAFGAIAIAKGLGSDEIAAGALLMGALFLVAGRLGLIDAAARAFPRPLIRGVQLTVGLLFLEIAWGLVTDPPKSFAAHALVPETAVLLAAIALALLLVLRSFGVALALVAIGVVVAAVQSAGDLTFGPSAIHPPSLDYETLLTALAVLVVPQVPLTFANSCLATSDAARSYFGERRAERVKPGRLATSLGAANLFAGAIAGMPVCHGAGGMTAHVKFGARTAGAPLFMGAALIVVAIGLGAGLAVLLPAFPLPILAALLAGAGILHVALLGDLRGVPAWAAALLVGVLGFTLNLAIGLAAGLLVWWVPRGIRRLRSGAPG